jgi:hypothetical protein
MNNGEKAAVSFVSGCCFLLSDLGERELGKSPWVEASGFFCYGLILCVKANSFSFWGLVYEVV